MAEAHPIRQLNAGQVAELVRRYLQPHQPPNYHLDVLPDGVRQEEDWWYVLVRPDRENVRAYDYYARLAEAEVTLRDDEGVNVLLVPVLPE